MWALFLHHEPPECTSSQNSVLLQDPCCRARKSQFTHMGAVYIYVFCMLIYCHDWGLANLGLKYTEIFSASTRPSLMRNLKMKRA